MASHLIELLTAWVISVISASGYLGIFVLMGLESALIPIPSEATMTFAGYLASVGKFNFWMVVFVGAFANLTGSIIAYALGYWGEDVFIRELIKKYGKFLLVTVDEYERAERWFRKHGPQIAFSSRLLPVVRTFISLPCGVAKMNFTKFCIYTFGGAFIWSLFLTYIGYTLGKNWNSLHVYYQKFEFLIVGSIIILGIWYIWHKVKKIKK